MSLFFFWFLQGMSTNFRNQINKCFHKNTLYWTMGNQLSNEFCNEIYMLYKCMEIGVTVVVCIHTGTCSLTPSLDSNLCLYLSMREEKSLYRLSTAVHHCLMLAAWRFPLATNPSASCKSKLTLSFVSWNHEKWYLVVHLLWDKHFLHFVLLFKYILRVIEIFHVIRVIFPSTSLQNK